MPAFRHQLARTASFSFAGKGTLPYLTVPGLPWVSTVARCGSGCRGLLRPSEAARATHRAAQRQTSLPLSGCLEQESSRATGHTENTAQMVATQQLGTYPGPVCFTGADIANLFHFIISKDISPVIRMLLFPLCPFAVILLRGKRSMPITIFFLLETCAISNPATAKMWPRAKEVSWVTLTEFSVLKHSYSSEYD